MGLFWGLFFSFENNNNKNLIKMSIFDNMFSVNKKMGHMFETNVWSNYINWGHGPKTQLHVTKLISLFSCEW